MLVVTRKAEPGNDSVTLVNNTDQPLVFQPGEVIGKVTIVKSISDVRIGFEIRRDVGVVRSELTVHKQVGESVPGTQAEIPDNVPPLAAVRRPGRSSPGKRKR